MPVITEFLHIFEGNTSGEFQLHLDGATEKDLETVEEIFQHGVTKTRAYTEGPGYSLVMLDFDAKHKLVTVRITTDEPVDDLEQFIRREFKTWVLYSPIYAHLVPDSVDCDS